jgi:release factor glutamine methyltransferase
MDLRQFDKSSPAHLAHLAPSGTLVIEHGFDQSERVRELFSDAGFLEIVAARDLAGIPRVVAGRNRV